MKRSLILITLFGMLLAPSTIAKRKLNILGALAGGNDDENAFVSTKLVPDLLDEIPPETLTVKFSGDLTVDAESVGRELTPRQVRIPPLFVEWKGMKADHFYTVMMVDPDVPARSVPNRFKLPVLHWLRVNVPGSHYSEGFELAPYFGSGPPRRSGLHRYTILAFDEGDSPKDYSLIEPLDVRNNTRRIVWSLDNNKQRSWTVRDFVEWSGMGNPVAGNFFQARYDDSVPELMETFYPVNPSDLMGLIKQGRRKVSS